MSRTRTVQLLLEHGPLNFAQLREVTGWTTKTVNRTLEQLQAWGSVQKTGRPRSYVYELASPSTVGGFTASTGPMPAQHLTATLQNSHGCGWSAKNE